MSIMTAEFARDSRASASAAPIERRGIARGMRHMEPELLDMSRWPAIDEETLPADIRSRVRLRRLAVALYLNGESLAPIKQQTGQSPTQVYRLLERCLSVHDDGRIYGLRGLIPWARIETKPSNSAVRMNGDSKAKRRGAFQNLLRRVPELEQKIVDYALGRAKSNGPRESRPTVAGLQRVVLSECRRAGLDEVYDYPFCTQNLLRNTLALQMRKIYASHPHRAVTVLDGKQGARLYSTGDGRNRPIYKPFQRVECDAHHLDAVFCVFVPTPYGDLVPVIVERPWVICITEALTSAHLGYHLSFRKECNANDVLLAMRSALCPWQPKVAKNFSVELVSGAGYPSSHNPGLCGVGWSEFFVDAAKINHCERVVSKMAQLLRATPYTVPRHNPNDRPIVERLFGTLEEHGFHRMPNTTGSNPLDARRGAPELAACKYFVTLDVLEVLLDALFANYNATPHTKLYGRTPLTALDWHIQQNGGVGLLPRVEANDISNLLTERAVVTVRGAKPALPSITFNYARYTSDALRHAYHLVGRQISIEYISDEGRVVRAFGPDGAELGPLFASPPWHSTSHSIEMRLAAMRHYRNNMSVIRRDSTDPVLQTFEHLATKAWRTGLASAEYLAFFRHMWARREDTIDAVAHMPPFDEEKNSAVKKMGSSAIERAELHVAGQRSSSHHKDDVKLPTPRTGIVR